MRIKSSHPKYKAAKWCCEFFLDGKTYKKSISDAQNKKEAEDFERDYRKSIKGGTETVFADTTNFKDFVAQIYLPYAKNNNVNYKNKVFETNRLVGFFGDYRLKAVTPELIEKFKTARSSESVRCQKCRNGKKHVCDLSKVSASTVNKELTTLSKILSLAVQNKKIADNPKRFVPNLAEAEPRERFLTPAEKEKLFAVLQDNEQLLAIVMIAILTGWRRGQILGLRKISLDDSRQSATIGKSKRSPSRKVPVSSIVWKILEKLANEAEDFLFINKRTGQPLLDPGAAWQSACAEAGIEGLRFHDLRRTFAIEMLNLNVGEFTIQTALGHSDIKTTKIYAQVQNEYLRESLERLASSGKIRHSAIFPPSKDLGTKKKDKK